MTFKPISQNFNSLRIRWKIKRPTDKSHATVNKTRYRKIWTEKQEPTRKLEMSSGVPEG